MGRYGWLGWKVRGKQGDIPLMLDLSHRVVLGVWSALHVLLQDSLSAPFGAVSGGTSNSIL